MLLRGTLRLANRPLRSHCGTWPRPQYGTPGAVKNVARAGGTALAPCAATRAATSAMAWRVCGDGVEVPSASAYLGGGEFEPVGFSTVSLFAVDSAAYTCIYEEKRHMYFW